MQSFANNPSLIVTIEIVRSIFNLQCIPVNYGHKLRLFSSASSGFEPQRTSVHDHASHPLWEVIRKPRSVIVATGLARPTPYFRVWRISADTFHSRAIENRMRNYTRFSYCFAICHSIAYEWVCKDIAKTGRGS